MDAWRRMCLFNLSIECLTDNEYLVINQGQMKIEKILAEYIVNTTYEDLPEDTIAFAKKLILRVIGTTVAGATEDGCETVTNMIKDWGGKEEATIFIHGGKVPAHNAAFANSIMARALDYEDGISPGAHLGATVVPVALATSELTYGCDGKDFLTAVVLGLEIGSRFNAFSNYDGFDPTGIVSVIAAAATAGKIIGLDSEQMLHALALAFNKSGGSFQCNIDGTLAVRVIQGFVSEGGLLCARLAQQEITGPFNFVDGIYGYGHLYGEDGFDSKNIIEKLGQDFKLHATLIKKYPSCGCTLSTTDVIHELIGEFDFNPEDVERVEVRLTPHCFRLVGHRFKIGDNPRVDGQFSLQYCVANAIIRKSTTLEHFTESYVQDPQIRDFANKVVGIPDEKFNDVKSLETDVTVTMKNGDVYRKYAKMPRGMQRNPLSKEEHLGSFRDCMDYASKPLSNNNIENIVSRINDLDSAADVRALIPLLICEI